MPYAHFCLPILICLINEWPDAQRLDIVRMRTSMTLGYFEQDALCQDVGLARKAATVFGFGHEFICIQLGACQIVLSSSRAGLFASLTFTAPGISIEPYTIRRSFR